ncbi:MAG: 50S ribosomal protein L18 [Oscillospiraceae bacterium]|nr:50S ribosomal protein L18 [Oscillospiraceae bacterium]
MVKQLNKNKSRLKRHRRVRGKISGTAERPRLNVFRSSKHIYAQLIDDVNGMTLVSASTVEKEFTDNGGNKESARLIGKTIAKRAIEKNYKEVVFDRGGYVYHGRISELAEGARECGLKF